MPLSQRWKLTLAQLSCSTVPQRCDKVRNEVVTTLSQRSLCQLTSEKDLEDTYIQGDLPIATSVKSLNVFSKNKLIHYFSRIFPSQTFFFRTSPLEVFLGKRVLKICSKFAGEHTGRRHGCSLVNCCIFLEHIFVRAYLECCICLLLTIPL